MIPIRPFKISVYNRAGDYTVGDYFANQVPTKGDLLSFYGYPRPEGDPWHLAGFWVVDQIVWGVSNATSMDGQVLAGECGGDPGGAYCQQAEIHVWPAEAGHWYQRPRWAKVYHPEDEP